MLGSNVFVILVVLLIEIKRVRIGLSLNNSYVKVLVWWLMLLICNLEVFFWNIVSVIIGLFDDLVMEIVDYIIYVL